MPLHGARLAQCTADGLYASPPVYPKRSAPCARAALQADFAVFSITLRRPYSPEGPSTQYLMSRVPKIIPLMEFGTRVLKNLVLGFSGFKNQRATLLCRVTFGCCLFWPGRFWTEFLVEWFQESPAPFN